MLFDKNLIKDLRDGVSVLVSTLKEYRRPVFMLKPKIYRNDAGWIAYYGDDITDPHRSGLCGTGSTPQEAALDFDKRWVSG